MLDFEFTPDTALLLWVQIFPSANFTIEKPEPDEVLRLTLPPILSVAAISKEMKNLFSRDTLASVN
jgi:hypothetical protein